MQVNITFRHMEASQALKDYALEKTERLKKYFEGIVDGHVVLSQEKIRHLAEITLVTNGLRMNAKDENSDFYAAIDAATSKIERQLKRYKEKLRSHQPRANKGNRTIQESVFAYDSFVDEDAPRVLQTDHYTTHPKSLDEAVMEIDLSGKSFLVFTDDDEKVKVVYRREDGNYGLIEPE